MTSRHRQPRNQANKAGLTCTKSTAPQVWRRPAADPEGLWHPRCHQQVLEGYHPGDEVTIEWTDTSGQSRSTTVTPASGPAAGPRGTGPS
jgi:hypothetical protein